MKIFYFCGATLPSYSAQSVHVMKMCSALTKEAKSNSVTLFAKAGGNFTDEDVFKYYGVEQIFSLVLSRKINIPFVTGFLRFAAHNWAVHEYGRPDLAYGRDIVELSYLVDEYIPVVYEAHEVPGSFIQKRCMNDLIRRKLFRGVVVISESLKADMLKTFPLLRSEKIIVAPDSADIFEKDPVPKSLSGRSQALKIGYAGSLHEGKGMEIIASLAKVSPDFDFHVFGGTKTDLKIWQAKNLSSNLYMHGHIPHAELPASLMACDILIAPYRDKVRIKNGRDISRWMSPMKIFEYMALKKPILASDLPAIREILTDGEDSLLLNPNDAKAWLGALEQLKDRSLRKKLVEKAFEKLENSYSWQQRARNILKFVEK